MFSELEVQEKAIPEMLANVKGLSPSEPGTTKTFILILVLTCLFLIKKQSKQGAILPKRLFKYQVIKHKLSEMPSNFSSL